MTEHWKKNPSKAIRVYKNQDFYELEVMAKGMLWVPDLSISSVYCAMDIVDTELGHSIKQSLSKSRMLDMVEFQKIWSQQDVLKQKGEEKNKLLIEKYGYKNKRELYKNMDCCWIKLQDRIIEIAPWHHKTLDSYSGISNDGPEIQHLPESISDAELGAAIREGFSRCTSAVR